MDGYNMTPADMRAVTDGARDYDGFGMGGGFRDSSCRDHLQHGHRRHGPPLLLRARHADADG